MAKTLDGTTVFNDSTTLARSLRTVSTLRLVLGLTALLGAIIFLEGTSWDIQWHSYIGRDRTLIPPHLMMLSGVTLSGISGLNANSFDFLSFTTGGDSGPFYTAAHIQGTGKSAGNSVWVEGDPPPGNPVPEPSTIVLALMAGLVVTGARCRVTARQT